MGEEAGGLFHDTGLSSLCRTGFNPSVSLSQQAV